MKRFLLHLLKVFIGFIAVIYLLDYAFTAGYVNSKPRNKIALAYTGKPQDYDVIFLGSSRANNHFVPQLFIDKGYSAYNFGMSGSRLEESALLLELLLAKGTKIKNLVVEVDLNINSNGFSEGTRAYFYPYLKESVQIRDYYKNIEDFDQLYYLPFYRYLKYDAKIGSRELFFTIAERPSKSLQRHGFYPLKGKGKNMKYDLSKYKPKRNTAYEKIKAICKANGIHLIAITTPMCENVKNAAYFEDVVKLYPEVHNFEAVVTSDDYFSSCGHMNEKGATIFTQFLLDKFFQ